MGEEDLKARLKRAKPVTFKPVPVFFEDGDRIDFYWKDVMAHSESVHHDGRVVGTVHKAMAQTTRLHCTTDAPPIITQKDEVVGISINMEALRATSFAKLAANIIERMTDKERKELREELDGTICFNCFRKIVAENGEDCACIHEP